MAVSCLGLGFPVMNAKQKLGLFTIGFLLVVDCLVWQGVFERIISNNLEVDFFDVGQGDAIFIKTPKKHQILIDGGPNSKILEKLAREIPFWDRSIDVVILSHPEKDHLTGLLEVLKKYKIDYILWTGIVRQTPEYQEWQKSVQKEGAKIITAQSGQRLKAGNVWIDILSPSENLSGREFENSNDTSVVLRMVFGENSFLFTGDIPANREKKLIEQKINFASDVLKVSHHGSKYSTIDDFLYNLKAVIAVITVGDNNYGHPTQEVLQRLKNFGIEILRTDEQGDIKIFSDGKNLKLKTNN